MVVGLPGLVGPFVHQHVKMLKVECEFGNEVAPNPSQLLEEINVKATQLKQPPAASCLVWVKHLIIR